VVEEVMPAAPAVREIMEEIMEEQLRTPVLQEAADPVAAAPAAWV
jgi:hypothetical protein